MGKSIIIADIAIIAYLQYTKTIGKIYIVFSSDLLMNSDKKVYDEMKKFMTTVDIILCVGLESVVDKVEKIDFMVIDEADHPLVD